MVNLIFDKSLLLQILPKDIRAPLTRIETFLQSGQ